MRFLKEILLITMTTSLVACSTMSSDSKQQNDYLKQAKTVAPTKVPANLDASGMQPYYPIPPVTMGPLQQPQSFSIVPPGSRLAQSQMPLSDAKPALAPARTSAVVASSNNTLVLNLPYQQAWSQTGKALQASGYKVMQQDKSMGAYFVLDLAGTGGQLKANTPIYQVHVKPTGNATSITLFDDKGNPADAAVGSRILGALRKNL